MGKIIWTEKAASHLEAIHQFIAKDSTVYANRFIKILISKTQILKKYPYSGRMLPELQDESIREIIYQNYRIIYRITNKDAVTILAVIQGNRLLENAF
jgi:toxin ParE1/3/4